MFTSGSRRRNFNAERSYGPTPNMSWDSDKKNTVDVEFVKLRRSSWFSIGGSLVDHLIWNNQTKAPKKC